MFDRKKSRFFTSDSEYVSCRSFLLSEYVSVWCRLEKKNCSRTILTVKKVDKQIQTHLLIQPIMIPARTKVPTKETRSGTAIDMARSMLIASWQMFQSFVGRQRSSSRIRKICSLSRKFIETAIKKHWAVAGRIIKIDISNREFTIPAGTNTSH